MIKSRKQIFIPLVFGILFAIVYSILPLKLFIALIGASVLGISCVYDIRIGVMASVVALPFLPDILALALIIFIFGIFIFNSLIKDDYKFKPIFADLPIVLFVIVISIATLTSINISGSFRDLAIHLCSVGLVIMMVSSIKNKEALNTFLTLFVMTGTLVALYGISQYFTGVELDPAWVDEANNPEISTRIFSVFGNPNILAEYLIMGIPVSVSLFFVSKKITKKLLFFMTTVILLITLVLTMSRGSWLGIAFGAFVFILLINKKLLLLAIPAGVVGMFALPDSILNRILSIGNLADSSNAYRIKIWSITLDIIKDNWISGVGFGYEPFKQTFETYIRTMPIYHAHNTYLELFTELGIGGILLFLVFIFVIYKYAILKFVNSKDKYIRYVIAGLLASISALLLQGLVEHVLYLTKIIVTFWTLIGCLIITMRLEDNSDIQK